DLTPPSLSLAMNNDAVATAQDDTTVYTLPYGITAPLALTITNDTSKDILKTANLGATPLDLTKSSWSVSLPVPVDGDNEAAFYTLTATDSVKNALTKVIKVVRPFYAQAPQLRWVTPPNKRAWGAGLDSLQLSIKNGDSAITPKFDLTGFTQSRATIAKLWQTADSSLWLCVVTLGEKDSGTIAVMASNRSGKADTLDTLRLSRYDPRDGAIPSIFVSQRTNTWVASNTMTLSGKAYSGLGKPVKVVVTIGAWKDSTNSGTDSTWTLPVPLTTEGHILVDVFARDEIDQISTTTKLTVKHDSKKPGLSITAPSSNDTLRTNSRSMPFGVTSTDSLGVKSIQVWRVGAGASDTIPLVQDAGTASAWGTTITSPQGWSRWIVRAVDSAGNDSLRSLVILSDTIKPSLAFSSPKNVEAIAGSSTAISLTASDNFDLDSVTIGDAKVSSPWTRTYSVPAAGTSTTIRIAAWDRMGNLATDSVILTGIVQSPVQTAGVAPGATGREFFFDAKCPDAGATLQDSASGWAAWSGRQYVANTTSKSLRCNIGGRTSEIGRFGWTAKDTAMAMPAPIAAKSIPDSAWTMAADTSGTIWIVSTYDSAWYWPKGDSAWRRTKSQLSSKKRIIPVGGTTAGGSLWFMGHTTATTMSLVQTGTGSISAGATLTLAKTPESSPYAWIGTTSLGIAYANAKRVVLERRSLANLTIPETFTSIGQDVASVDGIAETKAGTFTAITTYSNNLGPATFIVLASDVASTFRVEPSSITSLGRSSLIGTFTRMDDGSTLLTSFVPPSGPGTGYSGTVQRYAAGSSISTPESSAPFSGLPQATTVSPRGSTVWVGISAPSGSNRVDAYGASSLTTLTMPTQSIASGPFKLVATPSGSAWAALIPSSSTQIMLYRYYPR
ncbi:MAG: hypothetical protein RL318_402, partial [Fibrobacterota bacterium]